MVKRLFTVLFLALFGFASMTVLPGCPKDGGGETEETTEEEGSTEEESSEEESSDEESSDEESSDEESSEESGG